MGSPGSSVGPVPGAKRPNTEPHRNTAQQRTTKTVRDVGRWNPKRETSRGIDGSDLYKRFLLTFRAVRSISRSMETRNVGRGTLDVKRETKVCSHCRAALVPFAGVLVCARGDCTYGLVVPRSVSAGARPDRSHGSQQQPWHRQLRKMLAA